MFGMKSPFWHNEDDARADERRRALKEELSVLVLSASPLLGRIAEILVENNIDNIDLATPSGLVFGVVNRNQRRMMRDIIPPFDMGHGHSHSHVHEIHDGQIVGLDKIPPEHRGEVLDALERFLKEVKKRK